MSGPLPVVASPLEEELEPLVSRLERREVRSLDDLWLARGEIGGRPVVTAVIGDGAGASERGLERLLREVEPLRLLLVGVAGGLSDSLRPGALLAPGEVLSPEGDRLRAPAPIGLPGIVEGVVASSHRIVSSADGKRALWHSLGSPERAVVDLESWGVAERLAHEGRDWTIVRAVLDAADEDLPLDFGALSDAEGQIVRRRVLWNLLRRPTAVRGVLDLRSRMRESARRLADAAEAWLCR